MRMSAPDVFDRLVEIMMADNGCNFVILDDRAKAVPHIEALMAAGFFLDSPDDLDGSFWQAGAGEPDEVREFFASHIGHYLALDAVLNEVFERVADAAVHP